jgi:hypothetical protein
MTKIAIIPGILLAGSPFIHAAPFAWTGAAADNNFFNEANWTDNGGPVTGNPFVAGTGMLGGPGAYNVTGATFAAPGVAFGDVYWDTGARREFHEHHRPLPEHFPRQARLHAQLQQLGPVHQRPRGMEQHQRI